MFVEVLGNWPRFLDGLVITVVVTVGAALIGGVISVFAGIGMLSRFTIIRGICRTYTEFFRGMSALVLMFWFVFVVPILFGLRWSELALAILALGLNIGGYYAEVVRGAVQAVPRGQWEAATALNLSRRQRLRRIIVPQALGPMIPPITALTIQLLKASALVSLVGISDFLWRGQLIRSRLGPDALLPVFTVLLVGYFVLAYLMTVGSRVLERRVTAGRA